MKIAFDEQGVEIPFPHRSIYFGDTKDDKVLQALAGLSANTAARKPQADAGAKREQVSTVNMANE